MHGHINNRLYLQKNTNKDTSTTFFNIRWDNTLKDMEVVEVSEGKNQAPFDRIMIVRTVVLFLALINQFLVLNGYSPLPFDNAELETTVTALLTLGASLWAWWKNNDVRYKARRNTQYLKDKGLK